MAVPPAGVLLAEFGCKNRRIAITAGKHKQQTWEVIPFRREMVEIRSTKRRLLALAKLFGRKVI